MRIGIIGATGKLGNILSDKLIEKGYSVTGIIRNKNKLTKNINFIERDIYDLTLEDINDFDIVVNTFNADINDPSEFITSTKHLIKIFKQSKAHLFFAGGAGVLLVDENTMLVNTPEIPEEFKPVAEAEVEAYKLLAKEKNFNWTYMAPPAIMDFDAPHTGNHEFSGNKLGINSKGDSFISYKDYADAFVEKIINPENHTVVGVFS